MSSFGAGDQWNKLPFWIRTLIATSKIRIGYRDHTAAEALLRASGLDWTILRPTALNDEAGQDWSEAGPETSVLRKIPRAAVAAALLEMLQAVRPPMGDGSGKGMGQPLLRAWVCC